MNQEEKTGKSFPQGSTVCAGRVNFSVFVKGNPPSEFRVASREVKAILPTEIISIISFPPGFSAHVFSHHFQKRVDAV
jgi:hypothetical protein